MKKVLARARRSVVIGAGAALVAASPAFAGGGGIATFDGTELDGVTAVVGGFIAIGIAVFVAIKVFRLGKRGGNAA